MSSIDPDSAEFDDYPWDPRYDGGPGDLFDPAEHRPAWDFGDTPTKDDDRKER